ncbi:MAG: hypothetical protein P4L50_15240 [Anaerolineaceae bacterium]|nr:hypothetical protein [Anaerolineaceae bacterium]
MRIHFGGHLAFYNPQEQNWLDYTLPESAAICQVLAQLGIPSAEIALSVVNDKIADLETTVVNDNDTLQFYPPMDGG